MSPATECHFLMSHQIVDDCLHDIIVLIQGAFASAKLLSTCGLFFVHAFVSPMCYLSSVNIICELGPVSVVDKTSFYMIS